MSLPHWIKWNKVKGKYEINNNMDCFEQERVRSVPSGRDMTQYHFNVEARDRLFDEIDKLRRYKGVSKQEKQRLFQNVVTEFLSNRFV